jgi:predicted nucleotidyltransferase
MKTISEIELNLTEKNALLEMKEVLSKSLPETEIILYGSKARGDSGEGSDMDLLVLVNDDINSNIKNLVKSVKYDIELKHDVIISLIVESRKYWMSALARAMPLHWNIDRDGITV